MYNYCMKKITTLLSLIILIGCTSIQSNIEVDSIATFDLSNYSDFSIKINESNISAEINPIDLERFKNNLKNAIEERGLTFSSKSNLVFVINLSTKDSIENDNLNYHYSRYYWDRYMYQNNTRTVTENILRVNLKDYKQDTTLWTVVTMWRDGSYRSIANQDSNDILVDEIMLSF